MKIQPGPSSQSAFQFIRRTTRRLLGRSMAREGVGCDHDSYVGLFQGIIETDASVAQVLPPVVPDPVGTPKPAHRPPGTPSSRASGFLRLEVDARKKATGCFLFFVDGEVLSGAIEGASDQTGFVDASFHLSPGRVRHGGESVPRPVAAVGRLHLEARHAQGAAGPGENLTIRFV